MTLAHGPSIVTSGLLMWLDAANIRSYPGSGTTWTDMYQNINTVTLNNSPTYTAGNLGYFTFNGSTQWASLASPTLPSSSADSTIIVWCWPDSTGPLNTYTGLFAYGGRSSNNSRLLSLNTNSATYYVSSAYWNNDYVPNVITVRPNDWNMVALVTRGSALSNNTTLYSVNSTGLSSITGNSALSSAQATTSVNLTVGCTDNGGGRYFKGRISTVHVYNYVFTDSLIIQNFNALRWRYGV